MSKPNIFKRLKLWFQLIWFTGEPIKFDDDTSWVERDWIRYEDIYIQILKGDKGYSIAWQYDPPSYYPVREMLPTKKRVK